MYFESNFDALAMKNIEGNMGDNQTIVVQAVGRKGDRRASPGDAEQRDG